jgi:Fe(3+) dicitrate transport protein
LHSDILPSNTLTKADPNLKDSKGFNGELGIRGTWKNFMQFDVNYFALRYNNRIGTLIVDDTAGTYFYKTNIGDMLNQGTEVYLELQPFNLLKHTNKYLDFSFFTSTSYNAAYYTKGTVSSGGKNVDIKGNRVENVPHWISRNGISYRYSTFMATFQVSYVSANYSDALNTAYTASGINGIVPSYVLMDVNLSYSFLKHYNIKFSLNNLANHYYFTRRATGYPGPGVLPSDGRSFVVSVGAKF